MAIRKGTVENLAVNPSFWTGKKVFVTGHTGFKGSWLCLWLRELGAEVTGYALPPPTNPSLFEEADTARDMRSIIGDIRDGERLIAEMRATEPEIVIHMAAQSLVRHSYRAPVETYSTNIMGTVNLLEAVRHSHGVRAVVNVTSDKCYENREWARGYHESDRMGGHDPYSSSKGCAELVTSAYRSSFFNPEKYSSHGVALASARAGNVIGGGDWAQDRLIPDIIRAIAQGQAVRIRSPHAVRPWQHALEPLGGYLLLAEKLYTGGIEYAEAWNFGPQEEDTKPVQWIVEQLVALWGDGASWKLDGNPHPHEATFLKLDCAKARSRLGWKPRWTLAHTLQQIVSWHKAHGDAQDMRQMTLAQISAYQYS